MYEKLNGWQKNGIKRNVFDLHIEALAQTMIGISQDAEIRYCKNRTLNPSGRLFFLLLCS